MRRVGDDYESGEAIRAGVEGALGRAVVAEEFCAALAALANEGLIAAFRYDTVEEAFERLDRVPEGALEELWLLALPKGGARSDRAAT